MVSTLEANPAELAPLDIEELFDRCMRKLELAERLLASFEQRFVAEMSVLEQSLAAGDKEQMVRVAHALKGASANMSARPLQQIAAHIEDLGRANRLEEIPAGLAELRREWNRFAQYRRSISIPNRAGGGKPI